MAYKQEIIKSVLVELAKGTETREIKENYNISLSTIYNWKKKYSKELEMIKESLNIKILIKSKDYQAAYNLAGEERFKGYFPIQSQLITILIKMNRLNDAFNLASEEKFKDYFPIQSQLITILIKMNMLNEAYDLASDERFKNDFFIQSQLITILIKMKKLNDAFNLASEERFKNVFSIQSQLITILIKMNRLSEAFNLASDERFKNDFFIQLQKSKIIKTLNEKKDDKPQEENNSNIFKDIIKSIRDLTVTEDMIINLNIYEWQKVILLIAFYEINNYPLNITLKYLKREQIIYQNNPDVLKILNKLLNRIKNKSKLFDIEFFLSLLNTTVNFPTAEKDYLINLANTNNNTTQNVFIRERKN